MIALGIVRADYLHHQVGAEIAIGRWEGLTREVVDERFPGERARRMRDEDRVSYRYAGGESLAEIRERARSVSGRLDARTTLIVAHAGINRVLVAVLAGLEARVERTLPAE